MQLSTRLAAIANFVPMGSRVIDVGTDHAYIPIYLMQTGRAVSCLATDINKGPLEKADKNIRAQHISGIRLKQTNGLEGLENEEVDVIMISGMGGFLITDILKRARTLTDRARKIILQPQQDIDEVRRFLHASGFKIEDEDFVKDEEKYYTVIVAVKGEEKYELPQEYLFGRVQLQKKSEIFKEWAAAKLKKQETIYKSLEAKASESACKRKKELEEEIVMLKEVMTCLS